MASLKIPQILSPLKSALSGSKSNGQASTLESLSSKLDSSSAASTSSVTPSASDAGDRVMPASPAEINAVRGVTVGELPSAPKEPAAALRQAAGDLLRLLPSAAAVASKLSALTRAVALTLPSRGTAASKNRSNNSSSSSSGSGSSHWQLAQQSLEDAMREYNESIAQFHGVVPKAAGVASQTAASLAEGKVIIIPKASQVTKQERLMRVRQDVLLKGQVDARMRALISAMQEKNISNVSQAERVKEFTKHLLAYPQTRAIASKEEIIPFLISLSSAAGADDKQVAGYTNEALALLGHAQPPRGRGIRILSIDGGGTKGLVAIETLKRLEAACERPVHELFDYMCGVSTGGLLAVLVGALRLPLAECERVYKECSERMFQRNAVVGTSQLLLKYAYYDTKVWEDILKSEIGAERTMLSTAKDSVCPKIAVVSCLTNQRCLKNFLFRNYNLPCNVASHYLGTANSKIWEAIRASSAAPGYFEEFKMGDYLHEDGGVLNNNPTAIAIHEAKHLWPNEAIQCIVSLGNGRYEPSLDLVLPSGSSLMAKVTAIVQSATNTEGVHTVLLDLLDPASYYRFNPYMSEEFGLDEIRPEKVRQMQFDADIYLRKNASKVQNAARQLQLPRRTHQVARDWTRDKALMLSASLPAALPAAMLRRRQRLGNEDMAPR